VIRKNKETRKILRGSKKKDKREKAKIKSIGRRKDKAKDKTKSNA